MQAQAYRITENRRLESVPPESVGGDWKAGDASYWLDLQGSSKDALDHYLGDLEVNESIVQLAEDTGNAAQGTRSQVSALTIPFGADFNPGFHDDYRACF